MDDRWETYRERMRKFGPRYSEFDLLSTELALSVLYTYDILHQQMSRVMAEYGLSKSTVNILMLLRHGPPEGLQLHDLGEMLLVSRANITGLIDHLEEREYVTRTVDSQDRRARYARITEKAGALLDKFLPVHYGAMNTLLCDLSAEDKQSMLDLLDKTRESLLKHSAELSQPNSQPCASLAS